MAKKKASKAELIDKVEALAKSRAEKYGYNVLRIHQRDSLQKQSYATLENYARNLKRDAGWHGGSRKQPSVGRVEGVGNLTKLGDGRVQNQHGVIFTDEERRRLESAVNSANRKRRKMLQTEAKLPRLAGGSFTGTTVGKASHSMGVESDFIIQRKTKSLQRFKSKEDYENYLENLNRVNSRDYIKERVKLYKANHIKALEAVFGDDAKDVMMKIRMMNQKEYMELIQSDENLEVAFIYDPSAKDGKLNAIRAALNMNLKEEYIEEV